MSNNRIARRRAKKAQRKALYMAFQQQQSEARRRRNGYVVVTVIDLRGPAPPLIGDAPGDELCTFERRDFFDFNDPIPGAKLS